MAASERRLRRILNELTLPRPDLEAASEVREDALADLRVALAWENVVGIGIAEKVTRGKPTGTLALTFYVRQKIERVDLTGEQMVPPALPEILSGSQVVPTDIVEVGDLQPQSHIGRNPLQPGFSIGHPAVTAGTFGAVVREGENFLVLSNSHVLARSGQASIGDPVLYPGASDGGLEPADVVGHLHRFIPFIAGGSYVNRMDAAVCTIADGALPRLRLEIADLNLRPQGIVKPRRDMVVVKVGSVTERTEGQVRDVNFRFKLPYPGVGDVGFLDQVYCTPYATGGDSGALVLEADTMRSVGLHFAGSALASVFSPIENVLKDLSVQLVP
ncbi:MAG TPA: hypothetical protein VMW27_24270 [Thermoanaerobaculia bacterium]|nr:hypothetical protein [Thermoanaerobaculia bacterium]